MYSMIYNFLICEIRTHIRSAILLIHCT